MVAPDETTFDYLKGRPHAPQGADWDAAVEYWNTLRTDDDAVFDAEVTWTPTTLEPFVTWGTNPGQGVSLSASVPDPRKTSATRTPRPPPSGPWQYMGLTAGTPHEGHPGGHRLPGLVHQLPHRGPAGRRGHRPRPQKDAEACGCWWCPARRGCALEAEAEGLDKVFKDFGAEWRFAGCSMCLGMNPDQLEPGERCASTSNRNFEGRQGKGGRTHLVSPVVAAATAVRGTLSSPSDLDPAPDPQPLATDAA